MGKIIISRDGVVEQEIPLKQERMAIGRRSRNDIVLDHPAVSGEHAVITTIRDESFLEDLRSTNGTFVNGHRIGKHFLQHQDQIKLAKYRIEYLADGVRPLPLSSADHLHQGMAAPDAQAVALGAAAVATAAHPAPHLAGQAAAHAPVAGRDDGPETVLAGAAAAIPAATGHIEVLNGANAGKRLALAKALTTLGRPGVQVIVIARSGDTYSVAQVEGDAAALLNAISLGKQPQRLDDGDMIDLGGTRMAFRQKRD